jgi:hypothetical protein
MVSQVVRVSGHMTCAEYTIDVTTASSSTSVSSTGAGSISDTTGSSSGSSTSSSTASPEAWTVLRRYSDFKDLHVALPSAVSACFQL